MSFAKDVLTSFTVFCHSFALRIRASTAKYIADRAAITILLVNALLTLLIVNDRAVPFAFASCNPLLNCLIARGHRLTPLQTSLTILIVNASPSAFTRDGRFLINFWILTIVLMKTPLVDSPTSLRPICHISLTFSH